jgi:hypothetical protein
MVVKLNAITRNFVDDNQSKAYGWIKPDSYFDVHNKFINNPVGSFVISRDADGKTLSVYENDIWDLTPY